jgi:hypothetical protein
MRTPLDGLSRFCMGAIRKQPLAERRQAVERGKVEFFRGLTHACRIGLGAQVHCGGVDKSLDTARTSACATNLQSRLGKNRFSRDFGVY